MGVQGPLVWCWDGDFNQEKAPLVRQVSVHFSRPPNLRNLFLEERHLLTIRPVPLAGRVSWFTRHSICPHFSSSSPGWLKEAMSLTSW